MVGGLCSWSCLCLSESPPSHQRRHCEVYLNSSPTHSSRYPPNSSLSLFYYLSIGVVEPFQRGFGQQISLQDRAPRGILPRFRLSLFTGFMAPCLFSRGLSPLDDGADKHVACRITELWQKKKAFLLNKTDVNNCWKQYRALRRGVRLMFGLAASEVAQFRSGPELPFQMFSWDSAQMKNCTDWGKNTE